MAFLIGTDEAGYGPNLGPLLVSASVWRVPDAEQHCDLYNKFAPLVTPHLPKKDAPNHLTIADSKLLYKPGGGLGPLEAGVLTCLQVLQSVPNCWKAVWKQLAASSFDDLLQNDWYREFDAAIPIDADAKHIEQLAAKFVDVLASHDIYLLDLQSIAVTPARFNKLIDELGTKSAALSCVTLDLVRNLTAYLPKEPIRIVCDKHGGRNNYAALLQPRFDDRLVRVLREGRLESSYDVGTHDQPIEISFKAKGESFLPSALASMASKYLRELAMKAFNTFWQAEVADLRPTAGYPSDAKRFRVDIADAVKRLGIREEVLWRQR